MKMRDNIVLMYALLQLVRLTKVWENFVFNDEKVCSCIMQNNDYFPTFISVKTQVY